MIFQWNIFLASISLTHCLIWLPFSLFNIIVDISPDFFGENATYYGIFTQLFGLASTVINPVLYAFFNENFQREFEDGIEWAKSNFCKRFDGHQGRQQHSKSLSLPGSGNPGRKNTDQVEMVIYFICKMMFDRFLSSSIIYLNSTIVYITELFVKERRRVKYRIFRATNTLNFSRCTCWVIASELHYRR